MVVMLLLAAAAVGSWLNFVGSKFWSVLVPMIQIVVSSGRIPYYSQCEYDWLQNPCMVVRKRFFLSNCQSLTFSSFAKRIRKRSFTKMVKSDLRSMEGFEELQSSVCVILQG
jgi:hypothetical protein